MEEAYNPGTAGIALEQKKPKKIKLHGGFLVNLGYCTEDVARVIAKRAGVPFAPVRVPH